MKYRSVILEGFERNGNLLGLLKIRGRWIGWRVSGNNNISIDHAKNAGMKRNRILSIVKAYKLAGVWV